MYPLTYDMIESSRLILMEKVILMAKRKPVVASRRPKNEVNMKAIYWTGSILVVVIIVMTLLLILNK
ncbi:hypothetical protein D3C85_1725510 [compost metagenome]